MAALCVAVAAFAESLPLPKAIYIDPPTDLHHPARMEVLHVPSGGVEINALVYVAAGPGPHPTVVICHGLPGNEKNLDLAQALRRDGWNAVTFNYRGSWGSPGDYRFAQNPDDARAVLAYLRDSGHAAALGIDVHRIALFGHSMGGWVAALVGADDPALSGVILLSAANMGLEASRPREDVVRLMRDDMESLAGVSAQSMADEVITHATEFNFLSRAAGLAQHPVLILSADDGLAAQTDALAAALRQAGAKSLRVHHAATDHSWSDHRVAMEAEVIRWLDALPRTSP
jgi:pimeloyl-ACP methyl ester carboxylesterase